MTDPFHSTDVDPWAQSPSRPSARFDPAAPPRRARSRVDTDARDRRKARRYGHYWAVVTALFGVSAVAGLASGDAWGLFALLLAGGAGWYARYLYRGGSVRIMIIPIPWI